MRRLNIPLTLIIALLATVSPGTSEVNPIITDWKGSIQLISTEELSQWPEIGAAPPVGISTSEGRIWLLYPSGIVNLTHQGNTDYQTLTSLYVSQTRDGNGPRWSPEDGILCSDGIWRSISRGSLRELNPTDGRMQKREWNGPEPTGLIAAEKGGLLVLSSEKTLWVNVEPGTVGEPVSIVETAQTLSTASQIAVSTSRPRAAWLELPSGRIRVSEFSGSNEEAPSQPPAILAAPPGPVWSLAWAGDNLIAAQSGRLWAMDPESPEAGFTSILEDPRLPRRWYRLAGGPQMLLVQALEASVIAVVRSGDDRDQFSEVPQFSTLLKSTVLEAGSTLEASGQLETAESFYRWALPLIRRERSQDPLDEAWPELERTLTKKRAELAGLE